MQTSLFAKVPIFFSLPPTPSPFWNDPFLHALLESLGAGLVGAFVGGFVGLTVFGAFVIGRAGADWLTI